MVLFLHNTSRVEADPHQNLLREKGGSGFPYLVWMDADGDVLAQQRQRSVEAFEQTLASDLGEAIALKQKAASDPQAKIAWIMKQAEFGTLSLAETKDTLAKQSKQMSAEQVEKLEQHRNAKAVQEAMHGITSAQELAKAGPKMLEVEKAGWVPKDQRAFGSFSAVLLAYAEQQKDVQLFERIVAMVRERLGDEPRAARQLESLEQRLEKLRSEAGDAKPADASAEKSDKTGGPDKVDRGKSGDK